MRIKYIIILLVAVCMKSVSFGQISDTTAKTKADTSVKSFAGTSPFASEEYNKYRLPSIFAGGGIMTPFCDITNSDNKIKQLGRFNNGFTVGIEQRIGAGFGVSLNGAKGSVCAVDNSYTRYLNFKSDITQGTIGLNYHFDNGYIIHKTSLFSPYISIGFGYMAFDAKGDLRDKNGKKYYYWPDGTIRDQNFDWENPQNGNILVKDYVFETELDSLHQFTHHTFVLPIGGGITFKFSDKVEANIS